MNACYQLYRAFNRIRAGLGHSEAPNELIFFVTNRCNLRCQHCFNRTVGVGTDELSLAEIEKTLHSFNGKPLFTVSFSGGEPFLRDDLAQIVSLFVLIGKTYMFMIPTNGYETARVIPTVEAIARRHRKTAFRVNVSLDGLPEEHNAIRRNPDSFRRALDTIKGLQSLKLPNLDSSVVCCTITRDNLDALPRFQKFMNDNRIEGGYNIVRTNQYNPSPYVNTQTPEDEGIIPDEARFRTIINLLFKAKKNQNVFRNIEDRAHLQSLLMGNEFLHGKRIAFDCPAGKRIGVIYHNGDVALCENYVPIGNLRDVDCDFMRVWHGDAAATQRLFVSKCYCAHPCFINPSLMKKWWKLL